MPTWRWCWPTLAAGVLLLAASPARAQAPTVTVGAGLQTSYLTDVPEDGDTTTHFKLNSARLYLSGKVTPKINFMLNTEYNGAQKQIDIIDAAAQMAFSPKFNIWMGRFIAPSDRANLYGPYYSNHWAVYTDGIQDGYPFVTTGRSDGVMYWGQFGKAKLAGGVFDGDSQTSSTDPLFAARAMVDFWDAEDGYYLNGTYYGAKNLLALGAAIQAQDGNTAGNVDFLLEKKVGEGGAFTIESQYNAYDGLGGYDSRYLSSDGAYVLAAYLLPKPVGAGKIQFLGKFAKANFSDSKLKAVDLDYNQNTTEINFNYIIKDFNARVMFFWKLTDFGGDAGDTMQDFQQFGVGLQIQM